MRKLSSNIRTMDQSTEEPEETQESVEAMKGRFKERASVITKSGMPPLEGLMRKQWLRQRELDFRDFLMIADCDIALTNGILRLTLDLRSTTICDAALKKWGKKPKILKKYIGLSGINPYFDYGGEAG